MYTKLVLLLQLAACCLGASISENDSRFFIVTVKPYPCETLSTTSPGGTCYKSGDCSNRGGTASGSCAGGLGVCCIVTQSCGSTVSTNATNFVNQGNPSTSTAAQTCSAMLNIQNQNTCQVRLDFTSFDIKDPDVNGECTEDSFTVNGATSTVPTICGLNTGQHLYFDVDPNGANPTLDFVTTGTDFERDWNIQVSKIPCDSQYLAPSGCLQYFTTETGTVSSFGFREPSLADLQGTTTLAPHHANQNYAACIATLNNNNCITWTAASDTSFIMEGDANAGSIAVGDPTLGVFSPFGSTEAGTAACVDYVGITGGVDDQGTSNDRYCGLSFPNQVSSSRAPFNLLVTTDGSEVGSANFDNQNTGFSLNYAQSASC